MRKTIAILILLCLNNYLTYAQKLDPHHIYLFDFEAVKDNNFLFYNPRLLTGFNPAGYNNQPYFFSKDELYITAQSPTDTTQTEIVALNFATRALRHITRTSEAEYSPTLMPGGKEFSSVRVELNGNQRLWSFPIDQNNNGKPILPNLLGVGYHAWLNAIDVACFIVGEPHYLVVANTYSGKVEKIAGNIGRGLQVLPNGRLLYVLKATEKTWFIKSYNPASGNHVIVTNTVEGSEDFAVMPDGRLLMAKGSKLYLWREGMEQWQHCADFANYGIRNITRLAVHPSGRLALVD